MIPRCQYWYKWKTYFEKYRLVLLQYNFFHETNVAFPCIVCLRISRSLMWTLKSIAASSQMLFIDDGLNIYTLRRVEPSRKESCKLILSCFSWKRKQSLAAFLMESIKLHSSLSKSLIARVLGRNSSFSWRNKKQCLVKSAEWYRRFQHYFGKHQH